MSDPKIVTKWTPEGQKEYNKTGRCPNAGNSMIHPCPYCDPEPEIIETAREVVTGSQYAEVQGQVLDLTTANLIIRIYDNLNQKNKEKFSGLLEKDIVAGVELAWKLVK